MDYLTSGELARQIQMHTAKGTLVAGWDQARARLLNAGLAWEMTALPEVTRWRGPPRVHFVR